MNDFLFSESCVVLKVRSVCVKRVVLLLLSGVLVSMVYGNSKKLSLPIIPTPMECEVKKGYFVIDSLSLFSDVQPNEVKYSIDKRLLELGDEGYFLEVSNKGISLQATTEVGLLYGKMTLRQLYANNKVSCVRIKDKPQFKHRGIMLDVSRHFFSKEEVKELLNWMSRYKLNRFHWHLTDDGGWRFEVDGYPELTKKTAFRTHHSWREWWRNGARFIDIDANGAGGYYTKEDIREVVSYAAERGITVIPEIEFPGHSREVLVAYPELSCSGIPYKNGAFCVGNTQTYDFMRSVLNEVMELFPSEMIHIGGDETNTASWVQCPKCNALMKSHNMTDVHELHPYIIKEAENLLASKGRRLIGWDEIASETLSKSSVIMSWRGEQAGLDAAKKGFDVILTPLHYLYLDYYQSSPEHEPLAHDGYSPIEKVYSYNPLSNISDKEAASHILGVQGNLWTEWIADMKHLEYMAFPRTLAVAEMGWSSESNRSWEDFRERLVLHIDNLQREGVNTYTLSSDVEAVVRVDTVSQQLEVSLKSERNDVEIRYTDCGLSPNQKSLLYRRPLVVKDSIYVKAATFKDGKMQGRQFFQLFAYHKGIGKKVQSLKYDRLETALSDGLSGSKTYLDGSWVNLYGTQDLVMDLGSVQPVRSVFSRWMHLRAGARRYLPEQVEVLFSTDGQSYTSGGVVKRNILNDVPALQYQDYCFEGNWTARFIKLRIKQGAGGMSVDEITVF